MNDSEQRVVHLVDDDAAIRRSVGFMLKTSGHRVESYETGTDLLKASSHLDQGCILLDIRMPGMDGLEVQQALQEKGVTLPVIIMTGHGDVTLAVKAMKAGAVDFIEKPFEKEALLGSLDEGYRRLSRKEATADRARGSPGRRRLHRRQPAGRGLRLVHRLRPPAPAERRAPDRHVHRVPQRPAGPAGGARQHRTAPPRQDRHPLPVIVPR